MSERAMQTVRKPLKGADKLLYDLVQLEYLTITQVAKVGEYKETSLPYLRNLSGTECCRVRGHIAPAPQDPAACLYANHHRLPLRGRTRAASCKADQAG